MRTKGKITSWNDEKGYGFITPLADDKRVFVHIKAFSNRDRRPEIDQIVTYALSADRDGRPCAVMATLAGDRLAQKAKQKNGWISVLVALMFLLIVGVLVAQSRISHLVLAVYLVASLLTFIMYAVDKSAARKGATTASDTLRSLIASVV
jgi:cold shock CspA family protein